MNETEMLKTRQFFVWDQQQSSYIVESLELSYKRGIYNYNQLDLALEAKWFYHLPFIHIFCPKTVVFLPDEGYIYCIWDDFSTFVEDKNNRLLKFVQNEYLNENRWLVNRFITKTFSKIL
jgi:hypothetical protein